MPTQAERRTLEYRNAHIEQYCEGKPRNCRRCRHHYMPNEGELTQCPECGEPRVCFQPKMTGLTVCHQHGGGSPHSGRMGVGRRAIGVDGSMRRLFLPQRLLEAY